MNVIFLRGVNVGGGRPLKPKVLADKLGLLNLGAAGTFVSTSSKSAAALTKALLAELPYSTEVMVCPAEELIELARSAPFGKGALPPGVKRMVSVMVSAPAAKVKLPVDRPPTGKWGVRVVEVVGRYALSLRRPLDKGGVYPNEVVERAFGVKATSRSSLSVAKSDATKASYAAATSATGTKARAAIIFKFKAKSGCSR